MIILPRQYKNKISTSSKIYCNLRYNKHQWSPINNTKEFHDIIFSEHANRDRIVGKQLKMWISIGYSTQDTLVDENDIYFDSIEALQFPAKPLKNWDEKKTIENLLNRMYFDKKSCLHHGFTAQHKHSFAMDISLFVKSGVDKMAENAGFKKALDSDSILLTDDEVKQYILDPYYKNGNFNSTLNHHPAKGVYPPSNRLEKQPPHFNDWYNGPTGQGGAAVGNVGGTSKDSSTTNSLASIIGQLVQAKNHQPSTNKTISTSSFTTTKKSITFMCQWNNNPESIIIDGSKLTNKTKMKDFLLYCEDDDDDSFAKDNKHNLDGNTQKLYFNIKTKDGFDEISIKNHVS